MNSKYRERFKEDWTNAVINHLCIDKETVGRLFDQYFMDSELNVYNSMNFKNTTFSTTDFYYLSIANFILQENGVLFWKYNKKQSVIGNEIIRWLSDKSLKSLRTIIQTLEIRLQLLYIKVWNNVLKYL